MEGGIIEDESMAQTFLHLGMETNINREKAHFDKH